MVVKWNLTFVDQVGLLPPYNKQQLPFAYHMYSREDDEALLLATEFKDTFSIDVSIDFVGVWFVVFVITHLH
jgi:hypothetical protein